MGNRSSSQLHNAARYAEGLGYGKGRFYFGIFGLLVVAIAFAAVAVYAVVVEDVGAAVPAAAGSLLMVGVLVWRVRTWSNKVGQKMSTGDDDLRGQAQSMRRWLIVFFVGAAGVTGLGVWALAEGRTGAGVGYIVTALAATLLIISLYAY